MTIDERLEAITQTLELVARMQIHADEQHGLDMVELREGQVKLQEGQVKLQESQARTENTLRRAIRLGVEEARNQRKRHQELEVLLKAFLESGGNGKH